MEANAIAVVPAVPESAASEPEPVPEAVVTHAIAVVPAVHESAAHDTVIGTPVYRGGRRVRAGVRRSR